MRKLSVFLNFVVLQHQLKLLMVLLPCLVFAGFGIPRIDFQDGLRSVFNSDGEVFETYLAHTNAFRQSETDVLILAQSNEPLSGETLEVLRDFTLDAQFIDGVETVHSLFSLRRWDANSQTMKPLLPFDLTDRARLRQALREIGGNEGRPFGLLSDDLRKTVLVVSLGTHMGDMRGPGIPLAELRQTITALNQATPLTLRMTGLLTARDEIISGLRTDQLRINILGAVFGFILSALLFRSLSIAVLNSIVPVAALIFALGLFGWLGFSINALTNALPVLVLVLASSDSIHMTFDLRRRLAEGYDPPDAIRLCLRDMASPVMLTSLTTIVAFSSLFASDSPIVRELALTGCAGVALGLITVLLLHPLVFSLACRAPRLLKLLENPPPIRPQALTSNHRTRTRVVATGGIVLTVFAFSVLWPIQPTYRFMENVDKNSDVSIVLGEIEAIAGPFSTLELPLKLPLGQTISSEHIQKDLETLSTALSGLPDIVAALSIADLAQATGGWDRLEETLEAMPEHLRHRLISETGSHLSLSLRVFDSGSQEIQRIARQVNETISKLELNELEPQKVTGFLFMSAELSDQMIKQLSESFLMAALLCPLLIGMWFRRWDFALIAILPNVLPIALVAAGLTLIDMDIQLTAALAMTIAFGIALDDSIHVFNRVEVNRAEGIDEAMRIVRPVLITTTLILSAGLAATQFSIMPTVRFFGILCVIVFFFALITDLVLLPAMLKLGRKRNAE